MALASALEGRVADDRLLFYHVVNHSTYHRGQVATMLRQLKAIPAPTDFLAYYDEGGL